MARPQPTDAHLRLANSIVEAICFRSITQNQLKIILFVLRLSWACKKKFAVIKNKSKFELAGVNKNYISKELEYLIHNKILIAYPDFGVYALNKNFEEWTLPINKGFNQKAYTTLLSENLNINPQFVDTVHNLLTQSIIYEDTINNLCGFSDSENTSTEQESDTPIVSIIISIYNDYFEILKQVENYPFDEKKDSDMLSKLVKKYPNFDLLEALNDWSIYKLDNPLTNECNPRLQINTWVKKGIGFGKYKKELPQVNSEENLKLTTHTMDFDLEKAAQGVL